MRVVIGNADYFVIVDGIGGKIELIGKLVVCVVSTLIGFYLVTKFELFKLDYPVLPTIMCFVISLLIGLVFFTTYGMGADTLLHCYLVDH